MPTRQVLAYRFGPDATFEGELVGALERAELTGALRLLDGVFVAREAGSGELAAVSLQTGSSRFVTDILDFRMNDRARSTETERALAGPHAEAIQLLAERLEPGEAMAALLVEHDGEVVALAEAVSRVGGTETVAVRVDANSLSEVVPQLTESARAPCDGSAPARGRGDG